MNEHNIHDGHTTINDYPAPPVRPRANTDSGAFARNELMHRRLEPMELAEVAQRSTTTTTALVLSGVFSLITLAMLSLTTVAALAPVLPSLPIRMLAMSLAFICIAAPIGRVFFARLRQARFELPQERAGSEGPR